MTSEERIYTIFLGIMLREFTQDEMAYMHRKVMHPSYGIPEDDSVDEQ